MSSTDTIEQAYLFTEHEPATERMQGELDEFLWDSAINQLAAYYQPGEVLPEDSKGRLAKLRQIAEEHLDFRQGKTRQETDFSRELPAEEDALLWEVGKALRMTETTAPEERYPDWLLLPGAANEAALNRLSIGLNTVRPRAIAALASGRVLPEKERERVKSWAPGAETEYDLSCAAIASMPNAQLIGETTEDRDGDVWRVRMYKYAHDGQICEAYVIGAPKMVQDGRGGMRPANSHDNFCCFADGVGKRQGLKVAIATTGIYVPLQHLTAIEEMAPYGYSIETFGHDHTFSGVERTSRQIGQEIKSGIDAAASLQAAIAGREAAQAA